MPEAKITTRLDSSGFKKGMRGVNQSVDKFDSKLSGLKAKLGAVFTIAAFGRIGKEAISASAAVEDLTIQFKVLFRDVDRAVSRVDDLKKFSAATPFQLEDIASASQTLEVFSEGVLGDIDSLKIFGDTAAAVGEKDLKNMSFWVGRLYSSLQSGRPIVDSLNALSRLKVLGPTVMKTLIDMSTAQKDANDIWDEFTGSLKRFEGGMLDASKTTTGTLSTMKDNWRLAFAAMGDVFEPLTKKAIGASTKIANKFQRLFEIITMARDPFEGAIKAFNKEQPEDIAARKAAKVKEFADRRAAEKKAKEEKKQAQELLKLDEKAARNRKKEIDKTIADKKDAAKRERDQAISAAKAIMEIKRQEVESVSRDRLAQIGGALGGAISPQLQVARRALVVQEQIAKTLSNLPPKIAEQLVNLGAYE